MPHNLLNIKGKSNVNKNNYRYYLKYIFLFFYLRILNPGINELQICTSID